MTAIDFTKPIQAELVSDHHKYIAYESWQDVTYIGPYRSKHVIADADGEYHTVYESSLRNKPVKLTARQKYDCCVHNCLEESSLWADQREILDMLYNHLVRAELIKEEN